MIIREYWLKFRFSIGIGLMAGALLSTIYAFAITCIIILGEFQNDPRVITGVGLIMSMTMLIGFIPATAVGGISGFLFSILALLGKRWIALRNIGYLLCLGITAVVHMFYYPRYIEEEPRWYLLLLVLPSIIFSIAGSFIWQIIYNRSKSSIPHKSAAPIR